MDQNPSFTALDYISNYSGKFVKVVLKDGRALQGIFFGTGPMLRPSDKVPVNNGLIFNSIQDIEKYKSDILNYKIKSEYFEPKDIEGIAILPGY